MKPLFSRATILAAVLTAAALPLAAQAQGDKVTDAQIKANASSKSSVEFDQTRKPSFYTRDKNGTEVVEFKDHGKATEIDVHSGWGTNYHMTQPSDYSPKIRDNDAQDGRVPSVGLKF